MISVCDKNDFDFVQIINPYSSGFKTLAEPTKAYLMNSIYNRTLLT